MLLEWEGHTCLCHLSRSRCAHQQSPGDEFRALCPGGSRPTHRGKGVQEGPRAHTMSYSPASWGQGDWAAGCWQSRTPTLQTPRLVLIRSRGLPAVWMACGFAGAPGALRSLGTQSPGEVVRFPVGFSLTPAARGVFGSSPVEACVVILCLHPWACISSRLPSGQMPPTALFEVAEE